MIYAEWTGKAKGVNRWHQQGRGKIYKDPEYAAFQQDLTWQLRRANRGHKPMEGDVMVHINQIINPLRDIDSLVKPALDCLEEAGVIHDDRQIRLLICSKETRRGRGLDTLRMVVSALAGTKET